MKLISTLWCTVLVVLFGCFRGSPGGSDKSPVLHSILDSLLGKYVNPWGMVDYEGLEREHEVLQSYLHLLRENPPSDNWTENDKLAYWINAYNAFTLELIINEKPATSIKSITTVNIPFVNSPWQIDFIQIGDKTLNLDDIEHGIIRKEFHEPRIHFALVCGAYSCPRLRGEAYTATRLNQQLNDQVRRFLADVRKNQISSGHIRISQLFQWYASDFTGDGSLIDYLNKYAPITIQGNAKVEYIPYDWRLNSQRLFPYP